MLRDMTDIIAQIKRIVMNVLESQKPTNIYYGTVISISPLKIQIDQKLILDENHLKLTRAVQDYKVNVQLGQESKKEMTISNGLVKGDMVTMIRAYGGQQYLVIDKEVV